MPKITEIETERLLLRPLRASVRSSVSREEFQPGKERHIVHRA